MLMKDERCYLRKLNKKIVGYCIFPIILMICLTFLSGSYYDKGIYYKMDDIVVEVGDKLPKDIINYMGVLADSNLTIETNAPQDKDGHLTTLGTYSYYLVYNDPTYLYSKLTNVKAKISVVDTIKPVLIVKENTTFDYYSEISPYDVVDCVDASSCKLTFDNEVDTSISGEVEVSIKAVDGGNNENTITTKINILEKPKPVIYSTVYYGGGIEEMNNNNNLKNSLLTEEDKINLRNNIVAFAKNFLGNPYVYGGTSLTNGTDCSGFTMSVYSNFGYQLPRSAISQLYIGTPVNEYELLPGDLVTYYYGHAGIYVGNGLMIHAGTSSTGIVIAPMFEGARTYRRIIY